MAGILHALVHAITPSASATQAADVHAIVEMKLSWQYHGGGQARRARMGAARQKIDR